MVVVLGLQQAKTAMLRPVPTTPLDIVYAPSAVGTFLADVLLTRADDIRVYRIQVREWVDVGGLGYASQTMVLTV